MNPPDAPKKEKKKHHNKRKVGRKELQHQDQERRKKARLERTASAASPTAAIVTQSSQPYEPTAVVDSSPPVLDTTVPPPSANSNNSHSSNKKKQSSLEKRSHSIASHDSIKVDDQTWLHWLRSHGEPPSNTTLSAASLKVQARHLFHPITLSKTKSPTSASGRVVRTSLSAASPTGVSSEPRVANPTAMHCLSDPLRRLMFEEIITWLPDLTKGLVLCFNHTSPHYFRLKQLYDRSDFRLPVVSFGPVSFFQLHVVVEKNPKAQAIRDGVHNRKDFLHMLFGNGNEQLSFLCDGCSDDDTASFSLLWSDFFKHKLSLLLFTSDPWQRRFKTAFKQFGKDSATKLLRYLADEVRFDVALTFDLCSTFETQYRSDSIVANPVITKASLVEGLVGAKLDVFEKEVNTAILVEVTKCYGSFISWTDSILSDAVIDDFVERAFEFVPQMMDSVIQLLGTKTKMNLASKQHLVVRYRRTALFQLMALARVRWNQRFVWWAVINTAIYYQASSKSLVAKLTTLFGISCSFVTLRNKLIGLTEPSAFRKRVIQSLEKEKVVVSIASDDDEGPYVRTYWFLILVFDNTQKNFRLKWQRGGVSSHFLKLTSRMFWQLHQGPWQQIALPSGAKVLLVYVDQSIPSPLFLPAWELYNPAERMSDLLLHPSTLKVPPNVERPPLVDLTGERVDQHSRLVYWANTLRCMYRHLSLLHHKDYTFRPKHLRDSQSLVQVAEHLGRFRHFGGLLREASSFQRRVVGIYRPNRPKIHVLCMPVMKYDETTRLGMAHVVVQLLKDSGLLVESGFFEADMPVWVVPGDIEERYVVIAGDGLSHERWRSYEKELLELQEQGISYVKHYRQCSQIIKALRRCILVPGDLHASLFHTLNPVYAVFYGGLIQPIQIALGFKHIDHKKVESNYRQAAILVIEILTRIEARLIEHYVSSISLDTILANITEGDDGKSLSTFLTMSFELWIQKKRRDTTDKWFLAVLNFFVLCRDYRTVRESIRNGDTIMLEALHRRFTYLFCAVRKPKCFENALHTLETFYHEIPYWALQVIRDNRTGRLYDGVEVQSGRHTTDRALDECMELVQHKYKSMDFPEDEDSFEQHSFNMPFVQQCATFSHHQYTTRYNTDAVEEYNSGKSTGDSNVEDKGHRKKKGVASKRTQEKQLIDEILSLSEICDEKPGREFESDVVWKVLEKTTVVLKREKKTKDSKKPDDIADERSDANETLREENEEEQDVSRIVPEMEELRTMVRNSDNPQVRADVANDDTGEAPAIDLSTSLVDAEADEVDEDVDEAGLAGRAAVVDDSGKEETVKVGKVKRKVKKIPINPLALKDLYEEGRSKMVEMNLPRRRLRRQQREARERKAFHDNLFDFMEKMKGGAEGEIEKLKEAGRSKETRRRYELAEKLKNMTI